MLTLAETSQKIPQTTVAIIGRWTGLYHRTGSNHKTAHRRPARYQKPGRITLNIRRLKRLGGRAFQAGSLHFRLVIWPLRAFRSLIDGRHGSAALRRSNPLCLCGGLSFRACRCWNVYRLSDSELHVSRSFPVFKVARFEPCALRISAAMSSKVAMERIFLPGELKFPTHGYMHGC